MALVARKTYSAPAEQYTSLFDLQREIDHLFGNFFRGYDIAPFRAMGRDTIMAPRLDIAETDKGYEVTAELPGVDEKDLKVSLEKGVLTIEGEKKSEAQDKGKNWHRVERSYGSFSRAISLPQDADAESIDAHFKHGVLTIAVAKKPAPKSESKRIEVKTA